MSKLDTEFRKLVLNDTLRVVYGEIRILSYSWLIKIAPLSIETTSIFHLATLRCTMAAEKNANVFGQCWVY
jgi:hypothetical protein